MKDGIDFYEWYLEENGQDFCIRPSYERLKKSGETVLDFVTFLSIFPKVTPRSKEGEELQDYLNLEWENYNEKKKS